MIQDSLDNAARYAGLHPLFARAFAWLAEARNLALADGRYEVVGEDLYVMVMTGETGAAAEKRFESHRRYIDIQVNLAGGEIMEWTPVRDLAVADDFRPDNDVRFHQAPHQAPTRLMVNPREFAVFWPEDAHKPCCQPGDRPTPYRKMVFKVAVAAQAGAAGARR
jgi:YhcH/YjgK/YiaL family protein